ncbi:16S rRNA (cytosine(1402)-N(4))-methyltransferase RsmH [Asticcacaulis sp. EMRT-3]|uniref:16S rRNA (cytosine(1402)-N(4))-methyltransferase RsmH n=1 Tax=Asticcacaulis sp. EMRT-3 TaxID=3040349 RepID=UPI0024AEED2D|nr:16S rRNA (cytosine(1402)-N(4))-methyltransferase RsmH [Asticcacaulis sp. EMRT-3]MDI7773754.1 16S rRNA (cytosine(1402)-N(4))-methyltransferase RsmH [Asticcacaulis sp. EMRT-3]
MNQPPAHLSVMLPEVLASLGPLEGRLVVDGTFGAGGYSRAFLEAGAEVVAFDRDARVQPYVEALRRDFPDRFRWINRRFSEMSEGLAELGISHCDAIVLDIGVSSMQLDEAERGFSFMRDGPLDMRMSMDGRSAADIVNLEDKDEIARMIWLYGEERKSRGIAAAIVRRREERPFEQTLDLAEVVEKALGGRRGAPVHPATRTFQGLRIAVNDELGELEQALNSAANLLNPQGVLTVVTFHSLEDRIVKTFFNAQGGRLPQGSRHTPQTVRTVVPLYELITPKAVQASAAEAAANPRARSAKLRAARRTAAPSEPSSPPASASRRKART